MSGTPIFVDTEMASRLFRVKGFELWIIQYWDFATGHQDIPRGSEDDLQPATDTATARPISVTIDASDQSFQFYSGGVYNNP